MPSVGPSRVLNATSLSNRVSRSSGVHIWIPPFAQPVILSGFIPQLREKAVPQHQPPSWRRPPNIAVRQTSFSIRLQYTPKTHGSGKTWVPQSHPVSPSSSIFSRHAGFSVSRDMHPFQTAICIEAPLYCPLSSSLSIHRAQVR